MSELSDRVFGEVEAAVAKVETLGMQLALERDQLKAENDTLRRQLAERSQVSASSKAAALEAIALWKASKLEYPASVDPHGPLTHEKFEALLVADEAQLAEAIAAVLEKQLAARDEALRPFAALADLPVPDSAPLVIRHTNGGCVYPTMRDCRTARAVLKGAA